MICTIYYIVLYCTTHLWHLKDNTNESIPIQNRNRLTVTENKCMATKGERSGLVTQSCPTLQSHKLQLARVFCPWNSPGKNTGVSCHCLLQGIFLTQNPDLLHCKQILYHLSHQASSQRGKREGIQINRRRRLTNY